MDLNDHSVHSDRTPRFLPNPPGREPLGPPCASTHRHVHVALRAGGSQRLWEGMAVARDGVRTFLDPDLMSVVQQAAMRLNVDSMRPVFSPTQLAAQRVWGRAYRLGTGPNREKWRSDAYTLLTAVIGDMKVRGVTDEEII